MDERKPVRSFLGKLRFVEDNVTAIIVLFATLLLFVNVIMRYVFRNSFYWAEELIRYILIWISFIGAAIAFRNESHFGVDLIFRVKSAAFAKAVRLINDIGCFVFCGFVCYYGLKMVTFNMGTGQISPAMQIPLWQVYLIIPLSGFVSMFYIAANFIRKIKTPAEVLHQITNTPQEGVDPKS